MPLTKAQIAALAPVLRLHPKEKYFPMDPMEFIRRSRFRHHRGNARDQGYNKALRKWITGNSKASQYYDIPVGIINAFAPWPNGDNRRPRDSNNGDKWNVFLEPKGKPKGTSQPTGKIPVFYFQRKVDTSKIPAVLRRMAGIKLEKYDLVSYWWFMGYNDAPAFGPIKLNHQGDWEHVSLKVKNKKIIGVFFAAHENAPRFVPYSRLKKSGGRVVVYCSKGSHASYERAGEFTLILTVKDETKDDGHEWDISQYLLSLRSQPWRNYAGAWGKVGVKGWSTGPLGPWHKRNRA